MEAATPGQSRPSIRESLSLAVRGLQTRAGVHGPRSRSDMLAGTIRLAVLLLLAHTTAVSAARSGAVVSRWVVDHQPGLPTNVLYPWETALVATAFLLVASGRYLPLLGGAHPPHLAHGCGCWRCRSPSA